MNTRMPDDQTRPTDRSVAAATDMALSLLWRAGPKSGLVAGRTPVDDFQFEIR